METSILPPIITFTTAWYDLGAKFAREQYYTWAQNLLQNVRRFNLIVYVEDQKMAEFIELLSNKNPHVYIIIFPFSDLPLYKNYGKLFEINHQRNTELNGRVSWKLVLLWCSKQFFVEKTEENIKGGDDSRYPKDITEYYGWLDIGYFRARQGKLGELLPHQIQQFPDTNKIKSLKKDKIHYGLVNPGMIDYLKNFVYNRDNNIGLPAVPLPFNQISIAGGFFILASGAKMSSIWREQFENHLLRYLKGGYVVKDDQYVMIDLIILNPQHFELWVETPQIGIDSWFIFQRLLI
jgi:hypothetical protein